MNTIEILQKLKVLLGENQFSITGSTALALHGLGDLSEAKDLDLKLVNPDAATKELLNRLQNDKPNKKLKEGSSLAYSFFYEGIKIDIWIETALEADLLTTVDGIRVNSIGSIISAKRSYNRPKDWIQLMKLSKLFFSGDQFNNVISSLDTGDEEYIG